MSDTTQAFGAPRTIRPTTHRLRVGDFWRTREVARIIGARDVKVKYKQAALGPIWLVLGPLGQLAAVTIAFSGVTKVDTGDVPYVLFALVGLCVWTFVQLSMLVGTQAIIANVSLVRRSAVPRLALVNGSLVANAPPVSVLLGATLVGLVIFRGLPLRALLLPGLMLWLLVFTWTVTALCAAVAARFRDVVAVIPLVVQAGIFVTPVGYPLRGAPTHIATLLDLNPVSGMIEAWRWALLGTSDPNTLAIGIAAAWTGALLILAWQVFGRLEVGFADYV